jgi:hypothetical protein
VTPQYGVTHIHPLALLATLAAGLFLIGARRSQAILPLTLVACLIPVAQRVVIASLDFNMIRLLILFGWARLFLRNELRPPRMNEIDIAFVAWSLIASITYVLRDGTGHAVVYRLGLLFDAIGVYFLLRMLLRRPDDTIRAARYLAYCSAAVGVGMAIEWSTGRNLFSIFGGVPAVTWVREGRLRCQGAFSHPIMAGSFGATLVPIFIGMWFAFPRWRRLAIVGAASGTLIALAAASSGALMSIAAGVGSFALWPLRRHTRLMRWGAMAILTALHFAREKPVWHLIARVSDLLGGEGYHRYSLIDAFINRWGEWWLLGTPSTAHWGPVLWDTTNQYVTEGVTGGIFTLAAFIALLAYAFRGIGRAARAGNRVGRPPLSHGFWCWGLGAALTAHAVAFISVSYFGQMQILLYLLLAVIAAEYSFATRSGRERPPARREARTRPVSSLPAVQAG